MGIELVRLLQLSSPALPVGAYTYSQGLEQAIAAGTVHDEATAAVWIGDAMTFNVARWELPLVAACLREWGDGDDPGVVRLDARFTASRETAELRAETLQMGHSLARLLVDLPAFAGTDGYRARLAALHAPAYPTVWSAAAAAWEIPLRPALQAYLWSWLENQVMAALKAMPLGQSGGQRLLAALGTRLPPLAQQALETAEPAFGNWTPGLALASAAHETQYSRLFRS